MMLAPECDRYMDIRDRETVDEPISADERQYCLLHERSCAACGHEAATWSDIQARLKESVEASDAPARPRPSRRARAGYAALLAAACVLVVVLGASWWRAAAVPETPLAHVTWGSVEVAGTWHAHGAALQSGARLRSVATPACVRLPDLVELCLHAGSEVVLRELSGARRRVELVRGRAVAALEKQPSGTTFGIATSDGTVTAIGTVFSVEALRQGAGVVARVQQGVVEAVTASGATHRIRAPESLHLTTGSIAPLSADEARSDMALVEHRLAPAETSAALPPKPSAVVEHPLAATANSATRLPAPTRSPAERLAAARALRASGQARAAALQYRALQQAHPRSAEAVASLVSLGDIELTELKNPRAALQAFDAYLARGGGQALAEEAHYGRIRALGALGRNSEQLAASERFLERYPNSPHSQALRRKLRTSPR